MATTKDYLDQLTADKATLVQILNNKGVTASDSETFTELVPKVDTISGGGGNIGYKVTFKVNGNDYYIVSCQQGESITAPPNPTLASPAKEFGGWQLNGVDITFPYTPSADIELEANIISKNLLVGNDEEIVALRIAGENTRFERANINAETAFTEDGKDLCAYTYSGGHLGVIVITKAATSGTDGLYWSRNSSYTPLETPFEYKGETYYYNSNYTANWSFDGTDLNDATNNRFKIYADTLDEAITMLLDAYFAD